MYDCVFPVDPSDFFQSLALPQLVLIWFCAHLHQTQMGFVVALMPAHVIQDIRVPPVAVICVILRGAALITLTRELSYFPPFLSFNHSGMSAALLSAGKII